MDRLNVRLSVGFNAIPMAVPHTRPIGITAHATRRELIAGMSRGSTGSRCRVPPAISSSTGWASVGATRWASPCTCRITWPRASTRPPPNAYSPPCRRRQACYFPPTICGPPPVARAEIDKQVGQAEEAAAVVRGLEEQYDEFVRGQEGTNLLAQQTGPLPTADELGAELKRYLAEQPRPNDPPSQGA